MPGLIWKIVNGVLAALMVGVSLGEFEKLAHFVFWAAAIIILATLLNFVALKFSNLMLLILPTAFLIGWFGTIGAIFSPVMKLFLLVIGAPLFYLYQIFFPRLPPRLDEDIFSLATAFLLLTFVWAFNFYSLDHTQ